MKIGLVLDDTLDTPDGVQQYVLRVGEWLAGQGHEVHYLVGQTKRTDITNVHSLSRNIRVQFNGNRMSMPLPSSRRTLRTFLQKQHYDVLHIQMPYSPFMAGQLLATVPHATAVIGTFHILPYSALVTAANYGLKILNYRSAKRFDAMLAVSQPAADYAERVYGYTCRVVPNPVNLAQFAGAHASSTTATNIVFLGRLVERKGAAQLIRAVGELKASNRLPANVRLILGGKGALQPRLQKIATDLTIADITHFAGFIAELDKADFLAQADVAVYPSLGGESFGIVLLEAMAAARGVVLAGDNPGYASVMPDSKQLVSPKDIASFADTLDYWLQHAEGRTLAAESQKIYVRQFDIGVVGPALVSIYKQALQSRPES